MDSKSQADSLAARMNKLTKKFEENIETAEEMVVTGNDIIEFVESKTQDIELYTSNEIQTNIINLQNMVEDIKYVRDTLRENTNNGRRVLTSITLDLLEADKDKRAGLVMSFAELNKAVADNMKLFILSYREISNTLLNLEKLKSNNKTPNTVNNTVVLNTEPMSTADLIKSLRSKDV